MLLPYYNAESVEAGCDEAGRGCLAGPVVAAAVILPKNYEHQWLNDSKQLSKKDRNELRLEIEHDALAFAVAEASNREVDAVNVLKATYLAMHRCIDQLSLRPEHLLIDGNRFAPYPLIPHTCIVRGDAKYLSIAAASVLAKTYRDDLMEKLATEFPEYGWERNAGYPTIYHRRAMEIYGYTPYHRLTFKRKTVITDKTIFS